MVVVADGAVRHPSKCATLMRAGKRALDRARVATLSAEAASPTCSQEDRVALLKRINQHKEYSIDGICEAVEELCQGEGAPTFLTAPYQADSQLAHMSMTAHPCHW
eukprot:TRINITY_DN62_c1_g1_i8.p5 TRINITY_DN62_c1_g1~~TRINITY_DN62_c1_g1_i8.p5  ORF type:complete len:106 (-),score=9.64 TRINITY_DN62_c1_g1_i8:1065-1382(-)